MSRYRSLRPALLVYIAAALVACANGTTDEGTTVVATTSILGDVVVDVVGDEATVEVLMGPGVDPHDFSTSASQAALLRSADLVVVNGLNLEAGMHQVLEAAAQEGANILELAPRVDPLPFGADHDDDHGEGDLDPHFYLDPLRMAEAVDLIAAAMEEAVPGGGWGERADEVRADIEGLHSDIEETLAAVPEDRRKLVTNHDALGYFADRYGFEVIGTVIPGGSTLGSPSAVDLAELAELLRREGVTAIFAETTAPTDLAEALAAELGEGVGVYELHTGSLGPSGSDADSYAGMMRANASLIAEALSG